LETNCVNVGELDARWGLCMGCARTLDEIARWGEMSVEERRAIMALLPARRKPPLNVKG
jgi:uncharacterized protein